MINWRLIFSTVSSIGIFFSLSMLLPWLVALYEGNDKTANSFLVSMVASVMGLLVVFLLSFRRNLDRRLLIRDGLLVVVSCWILNAVVAALPFALYGSFGPLGFDSFSRAFFESMSGLTTTGASALSDIESQPDAILLWRSFIQWIGGMGIIVFTLILLPYFGISGMYQLYASEAPGLEKEKMVERVSQVARALWLLYVGLTVVEIILLYIGPMNLFDAVCHAFTTMATGGFSTRNQSIESFHSAYVEWVITIFMLFAGMNFGLHHLIVRGHARRAFRNIEMRYYVGVFFAAGLLLSMGLLWLGSDQEGIIRKALFQASSIVTTTGYSTTDFGTWPLFCQAILVVLMCIGGCSGSTAGGPKVIRTVLLGKQAIRELQRVLHPNLVRPLFLSNRAVDINLERLCWGYVHLFVMVTIISTLILAIYGIDLKTAFTATLSSVSNVGPGLGKVGPYENYAHLPAPALWTLSTAMLMGRLELFTVVVLLLPSFWRKPFGSR